MRAVARSRSTAGDDTPYARLTPDLVVGAVEQAGLVPDGRVLALNSYENRVYQAGVEGAEPVVLKFYRPARWTRAAILEEHRFALELAGAEIPVVAPLIVGGTTLLEIGDYPFAVYPRRGGRWPDLDTTDDRVLMGRFLGRMHRVGGAGRFEDRGSLDVEALGTRAAEFILDGDWLPDYQIERYGDVTHALIEGVERAFEAAGPVRRLRIHGDCHRGNILWTERGPHFVDLDDCMTGPAIQDLWMLLAGSGDEMRRQMTDLLEGYEQFADFDRVELGLIEALRALRMIHYAAWLARRWHDPAFPRAFPWFSSPRYWDDHVRQLAEQLEALEAPPLRL
ncbi:MAG: serine/threonine protein kinase [Proteobacteria bacterium]|nr:serine/threonine protein kinase [Pseudomonadota bacterium]